MENIDEGNKLIAEFMGFDYDRSLPGHGGTVVIVLSIKDCLYHSSWNWLMPVVEKIESFQERCNDPCDYVVNISLRGCNVDIYTDPRIASNPYSGIGNSDTEYPTKIEAVWATVVEFIKWFNLLPPINSSDSL